MTPNRILLDVCVSPKRGQSKMNERLQVMTPNRMLLDVCVSPKRGQSKMNERLQVMTPNRILLDVCVSSDLEGFFQNGPMAPSKKFQWAILNFNGPLQMK